MCVFFLRYLCHIFFCWWAKHYKTFLSCQVPTYTKVHNAYLRLSVIPPVVGPHSLQSNYICTHSSPGVSGPNLAEKIPTQPWFEPGHLVYSSELNEWVWKNLHLIQKHPEFSIVNFLFLSNVVGFISSSYKNILSTMSILFYDHCIV